MVIKEKNMLVRDMIPRIIAKDNRKCFTRILSEDEYQRALLDKLQEEVKEFVSSGEIDELADIFEVIECYLRTVGGSFEQIKAIQRNKAEEKGSFKKRIFLTKYEVRE